MATADEAFWEALLASYYHSSDSLLEHAWCDLEDAAVEHGWATPATIPYHSRAKFVAACHAVADLYHAVLGDARHWLAHQTLTWALAQLADLEQSTAARPMSPTPERDAMDVLEGAYTVVEPPTATASDPLSFW